MRGRKILSRRGLQPDEYIDICLDEVTMKLSARNVLKGKVKSVQKGAVNSEVILALPDGTEIVSVITNSSAQHLGLAPGKEASAVIKASNVMIGTD